MNARQAYYTASSIVRSARGGAFVCTPIGWLAPNGNYGVGDEYGQISLLRDSDVDHAVVNFAGLLCAGSFNHFYV